MLINGFNAACNNIAASDLKVGDESMSAIRFRTTAKGNLPDKEKVYLTSHIAVSLFNTPNPEAALVNNQKFMVLTISSLCLNNFRGDFLVKWRD